MAKRISSRLEIAQRHSHNLSSTERVAKVDPVDEDTTPVEDHIRSTEKALRNAFNISLDELNRDADNILESAKAIDRNDRLNAKKYIC